MERTTPKSAGRCRADAVSQALMAGEVEVIAALTVFPLDVPTPDAGATVGGRAGVVRITRHAPGALPDLAPAELEETVAEAGIDATGGCTTGTRRPRVPMTARSATARARGAMTLARHACARRGAGAPAGLERRRVAPALAARAERPRP